MSMPGILSRTFTLSMQCHSDSHVDTLLFIIARSLRIEFPDALYHVTSRGDRREPTYEGDDDRRFFLATLAEVTSRNQH